MYRRDKYLGLQVEDPASNLSYGLVICIVNGRRDRNVQAQQQRYLAIRVAAKRVVANNKERRSPKQLPPSVNSPWGNQLRNSAWGATTTLVYESVVSM